MWHYEELSNMFRSSLFLGLLGVLLSTAYAGDVHVYFIDAPEHPFLRNPGDGLRLSAGGLKATVASLLAVDPPEGACHEEVCILTRSNAGLGKIFGSKALTGEKTTFVLHGSIFRLLEPSTSHCYANVKFPCSYARSWSISGYQTRLSKLAFPNFDLHLIWTRQIALGNLVLLCDISSKLLVSKAQLDRIGICWQGARECLINSQRSSLAWFDASRYLLQQISTKETN